LSLRTQPFRKGRILGLVIILAALIAAEFHLNKPLPEPVKAAMAPVYQGNELEKKTALTFNVVWGEEYIRLQPPSSSEDNGLKIFRF
jgi:hypothetical protein